MTSINKKKIALIEKNKQEKLRNDAMKRGVTLIWPAPWTHTHRGQISLTHEKTIVTGWLRLGATED